MSWLRIDDSEVLDDRVGDLSDRDYRARHAFLQYVAREANEDGIVHETRIRRAVFTTPTGPKSLTKTTLNRLIELELIVRVETLEDDYLDSIGLTRPDGPGWLRPSHWERFNPPRDRTNAERQRRYRQSVTNGVTNTVTNALRNGPRNGPVTAETRARASAQRPQDHVTGSQEQEQNQATANASLDAARANGRHEPHHIRDVLPQAAPQPEHAGSRTPAKDDLPL